MKIKNVSIQDFMIKHLIRESVSCNATRQSDFQDKMYLRDWVSPDKVIEFEITDRSIRSEIDIVILVKYSVEKYDDMTFVATRIGSECWIPQ